MKKAFNFHKNIHHEYKLILINLLIVLLVSAGFFVNSSKTQNISSLLYTINCLFLIFYLYNKEIGTKYFLFIIPIITNLIFLFSNYLIINDQKSFANFDTLNNFYPKAELIAKKLFENSSFLIPKNWNEKFLIFDFINAFFVKIFGRSEFVFMMVIAIYKGTSSLFIYLSTKKLFTDKHAKLAALLYLLNPLYIVHSAFIFKEAWIQLLFAIFIFLIISFYKNPGSMRLQLGIGLVGLVCIWERIYLLIPVTTIILLLMVFLFKRINKIITTFAIFAMTVLGFYLIRLLSSYDQALSYLESTRSFYSTYTDVDVKNNYEIGYVLGFIKLIFSPYSNLRKLELFNGISLLIFWASFFSQSLTISMIIGLIKSNIGKLKIIIAISTISFLAFLSYIAPFGFRQRDSIAIIYVMFSSFFLLPYVEMINEKVKNYIRINFIIINKKLF